MSEEMKQFEENQRIQRKLAIQNHIVKPIEQVQEKSIEKPKTIFDDKTPSNSSPKYAL